MTFTRGRRRHVDTTGHFCPHATCAYHGRVGWGNIRANGHPNGRRWRQLVCLSCKRHFLETHGTPLHGKQVDPDKLVWAIAALAEGLGIRAVARVFETDPNTVLGWLVEAADHLEAFSRHFLHDLDVEQVQMDELFALLSAVKDGEVSEAQAIKRLSRSPHWVWVAMDPVCKLILAVDVGDRTLAMAQRLVHQVTRVLAPHCAPLFLTDGFREYLTALVTHYGQWIQPERRQAKGPQPKPRWMPLPGLLYAQVVKSYRRRRIVGVKHRVIFGAAADHRVDPGQAGLEDQYRVYRAPQPGLSPACGGDRAAGQHVVQTRSGTASAVDALPCLPQFCAAPRQLALAPARAGGSARDGCHQALAAADAGDGSGADGSGLESERSAHVSRAPVAPTTDGLSAWQD